MKSKYDNNDYINKTFGNLTVKEFLHTNDIRNNEKAPAFMCLCICKNTVIKKASHIVRGNIQSCGNCHITRSKYADESFIGKTFGKLKVIGIGHNGVENTFICNCDCNRSNNIECSASMVFSGYKKQCKICAKESTISTLNTKRYDKSLLEDLIDKRFGKLVVKHIDKDIYGRTIAICDCDCGTKNKTVMLSNLYREKYGTKACGKCRIAYNKKYDNYEYIGKTINNLTILDIKKEDGVTYWKCRCEICDEHRILWLRACYVTRGNNKSCGCMQSYGETVIEQALKNKNINYKKQVTFKDLKGIRGGALRFDFGIYDNNNNLLGLIEYDGAQHFTDYNNSYYITEFELTTGINIVKENDKIKNKYCEDNNIQLVRLRGRITEDIFFSKMSKACEQLKMSDTYIILDEDALK